MQALVRVFRVVREEIAPLGGPSALSWRVVMVFLPLVSLSQFVTDAGTTGTSRRLWLVASGVGAVVFVLAFSITKLVVRGRSLRPQLVVLAYAVAGTARTLTNGGMAAVLGLDPSPEVAEALGLSPARELTYRLVGGALLTPALMALIAVAVCRRDAHRRVLNELLIERDQLVDLGQSTDAALTRTELDLTMAVRAAIGPAVRALDEVLDRVAATSSAQPAIQALVRLVDDEVRPMSHRLAGTERWVPVVLDRELHPRRIRLPLPRRLALSEGFRPMLMAFLFVAVAAPTALRHAPIGAVALHLTGASLVCWLAGWATQAAVGWVRASVLWAVVAVATAHAATTAVVVQVIGGSWLHLDPGTRLSGIPVAAVAGAATTLAAAVDARRSATEAELVRVVADLQAVVDVIDRRARLVRARLAHVLHGNLQGALHAAAIRLAEAPHPDAALVQSIRGGIAAALAHLDDRGSGGATLRRTLDELVATWSWTRTIRVEIASEVEAVIIADRDADAATAEVVREAVNNAIRHGEARTVSIRLRLADSGGALGEGPYSTYLEVVVEDDGLGWVQDSSRGLGTLLFDELCIGWQHADTETGTRVTALVGVLRHHSGESVS